MPPVPTELAFVRDIEFPPVVVFDALTDEELVGGWLADARIEARIGGRFDLVWLTSASFPATEGTIVALEAPHELVIETDNRGVIRFQLSPVPGGPLGSTTRLEVGVEVTVDSAFLPRVKADWQSNLDQLDAVLRGHPVDWANWDRDRASVWRGYLAAAGGR